MKLKIQWSIAIRVDLSFLDIDGTLAYPRQAPSTATVDAIRKAQENGHKVFVSTGRTRDSIPPAIAETGFDGGIAQALLELGLI